MFRSFKNWLRKSVLGEDRRTILSSVALREYELGHYTRFLSYVRNAKIFLEAESYASYLMRLKSLLHIDKVEGFELVRIGRKNDGGYLMLNDFADNDGTAYSFGICDDVSWDKNMASRGYDVFMYDHTVEKLPEENSRFHFFRQGIADGVTQDERLKTLEYFIEQNHHEEKRNMILKMDVEGAEWGFIESVKPDTLRKFSQIVLEFHGINEYETSEHKLKLLAKINMTHQLIHLHINNCVNYVSFGGKKFGGVIECSYVLRDKYVLSGNYDVNLPLDADMPNNADIPEFDLGHWNA